jgi:hypothetical protein
MILKHFFRYCLVLFFILIQMKISYAQYNSWKHKASFYILTNKDGVSLPPTSTEKNFPLLIRLNNDFFNFKEANKQGNDVRFSTENGTPLSYQIEEWNVINETASIWIKIPEIKGDTIQRINIFWGNNNAKNESNGKAVFNELNGYQSVWHMQDLIKDEVGTTKSINQGAITTSGIIGHAQHFKLGTGVKCGDSIFNYPDGANSSTTEAWFKSKKVNSTILAWGREQRRGKIMMNYKSPPHVAIQCYFADVEGKTKINSNNWNHVVHTYTEGESRVYVNGIFDGISSPILDIPKPVGMRMGGWNEYDFVGDIDEVRISSVRRTDDWIKLEYENQKNNQSLVGNIIKKGNEFSVSKKNISLLEGSSTTITATANEAIKVYWILKDGNDEIELSTDRLTQKIESGRVTGNKQLTLIFKAIYADSIKSIDIPIFIQENIPDPKFSFQIQSKWNGRDKIETIPIVNNIEQLKFKHANNLTYKWSTSGIAVSKKIISNKLTLSRAQNSGELTITIAVNNGSEDVVISKKITVQEPEKDNWRYKNAEINEKPVDNQFYARDDNDEGKLIYSGKLTSNPDSSFIKLYANGNLVERIVHSQTSSNSYFFSVKLKPGLITYHVLFGTIKNNKTTILDSISNIICGDAYIINGQSNAEANDFGKAINPFTSPWIRSFGSTETDPNNSRLNSWGTAVSYDGKGGKFQIGYWGIELAKKLIESNGIPICIINGAVGGSRIDAHQKNKLNAIDCSTIYGRLLWRIKKAGLTHGMRGIFWYQGENDQGAAGDSGNYGWETYQNYFLELAADWKKDFPNIQHYYLFQIWPRSCGMTENGSDNMLREVQRNLPTYFSNLSIMSTLGIKPAGTCHFSPEGYREVANLIFPLVEQYNYKKTFLSSITPPNLIKLTQKKNEQDKIELEFDQPIKWDSSLINQFYLDGDNTQVEAGITIGNTLTLKLKKPIPVNKITYLDSKKWNQNNILWGKNGIAALTFYEVSVIHINEK